MKILASLALASVATAWITTAAAADAPIEPIDLMMSSPDAVVATGKEWKETKTAPPGMKMIMILGSPDQPGPYIFRAQIPAGYKLPPHRHMDERNVVVLKGNYWSAIGESFEQAKLKKFTPGNFYITDANAPHFSWAETDVVIQEMGIGPVSNPIEYVRPEDDPRK